MNFRTGLLCSYLGMLTTAALAQEPSGRIHLDAVSEGQFPHFVAATIPFVDTDSQCPERRETLRFSEGILRLVDFLPAGVAVVGPSGEKIFGRGPANAARHSGPSWQEPSKPGDDHTWRLDMVAPNCRMDIDIRQQVSRENGWISLRLPPEESEILLLKCSSVCVKPSRRDDRRGS
jgi:hypothetical protein